MDAKRFSTNYTCLILALSYCQKSSRTGLRFPAREVELKMPDAQHDSGTELFLEDFSLSGESFPAPLEIGQTVVISAGALQGATGRVVERFSGGQNLVSLGGEKGRFWVRLPADLLRVI